MSIVGVLEVQGSVVAVSDQGELLRWDLRQIPVSNGRFIFDNNVSLMPSTSRFFIDNVSLQGVFLLGSRLLTFGRDSLYLVELGSLTANLGEGKLRGVVEIKGATFLEKKESLSSVAVVDEQTILVGTNQGRLYRYDLAEQRTLNMTDLAAETTAHEESFMFATAQKQTIDVTAIVLYSQAALAMVSTSHGHIYCHRTSDLASVMELTATEDWQPVRGLVLSKDEEKLFALHDNYVTCWSIKLASCIEYYEYTHPKSVLQFREQLLIAGPFPILTVVDDAPRELELSMRSGRIIRELSSEIVAVGGSEGVVDLLLGGCRLMTLFSK